MARPTSNSRLQLYDVNAGETGGSAGGPSGGSSGGDYAGVGALLKRERLRQGHDIAQVADQLRIRQVYLDALEEGHYAQLPAPAYVMGFLRSYGGFLGLDVPELLRRYKSEGQHVPAANRLDFPTPAEEGQMPRFTVIVVALVLAVIAYGGWRYFGETPNQLADSVAEVPAYLLQSGGEGSDAAQVGAGSQAGSVTESDDRAAAESTRALAPDTGEATATPPAVTSAPTTSAPTTSAPTTSSAPATSPAPATLPAPATSASPSTSGSQPAAPSAQSPANPAPASQVPANPALANQAPAAGAQPTPSAPQAPADGSGIRIAANADSWLQIRGPGGNTVFSRILKAGETYDVPPDAVGGSMITGNAGGIVVVLDGQGLPALGGAGVVRRGIVLEREALRALGG